MKKTKRPTVPQLKTQPTPEADAYKMQREDQGAPDHLDEQAKGEFGTARKAAKRPVKRPTSSRR
jgi:hypothetical protein